jgi:hypothetical protein
VHVHARDTVGWLRISVDIVAMHYNKKVMGFLGGPLFKGNVKLDALREGFGIVELSGNRYVVTSGSAQSKRTAAG